MYKFFKSNLNSRQSPIDIRANEAQFDPTLDEKSFQFEYNPLECNQLKNTGSTWQVACKENAQSSKNASNED